MQSKPLVSIIIPCFNEEEVLPYTFERVNKALEGDWHKGYEIIYINDGSMDRTFEILQGEAARDQRVKVLNFSRNFGHQAAVSAGIAYCKGRFCIGSHSPLLGH